MRKYSQLLIIIILLPVIFISSYFLFNTNETEKELLGDISVTLREESERVFPDYTWEELDSNALGMINDTLYNPIFLKAWDKSVYITESTSINSIKRFNQKGELLNVIGNGRGRGPGEILNVSDFDYNKGKIWVTDVNKREVMAFDSSGTFEESFSVRQMPTKIAVSDDAVYLRVLADSLLIYKYDSEGEVTNSFGRITDDQYKHTMSLLGRVKYLDEREELLYASYKASYLFYYDKDGNLIRSFETIDKIKFPFSEPEMQDGNYIASAPRMMAELTDVVVSNDTLLLKTFTYFDETAHERIDYIDFYSLDGEEYFYSVKVPFKVHTFSKIGNDFYFIEQGGERGQIVRGYTLVLN